MKHTKTIWMITREYAGLAEAGGVKNVVCSLSEGLIQHAYDVLVYIPFYSFIDIPSIELFSESIPVGSISYKIIYRKSILNGITFIFIDSAIFREKKAVYQYTTEEENIHEFAKKGEGHVDANIMNILFQKSIIAYALKQNEAPQILHCQDAHTALLPAFIRLNRKASQLFKNTRLFVTIHNAGPGYRQNFTNLEEAELLTDFSKDILYKGLLQSRFEPFLLASYFSKLTTVSPWYAKELTSKKCNEHTEGLACEFYKRNISIKGITNGIDFDKYNPKNIKISLLPFEFNPEIGELEGKYLCRTELLNKISTITLDSSLHVHGSLNTNKKSVFFVYQGRIALQKGIDFLINCSEQAISSNSNIKIIVVGQGDHNLEKRLISNSEKLKGSFIYICGYEKSFARLAVASSDFMVLPSLFEPCGLEDYIGQIYGTIPIAHAVGGLKKIKNNRTGFLYSSKNNKENEKRLLNQIVRHSLKFKNKKGQINPSYLKIITKSAQKVRLYASWSNVIQKHYLSLYEK